MPSNNKKAENFVRLAEARTNKIIDRAIKAILPRIRKNNRDKEVIASKICIWNNCKDSIRCYRKIIKGFQCVARIFNGMER